MAFDLSILLSLPFGIPVSELGFPHKHSFGNYYKIDEHIYLCAHPIKIQGVPVFCGFVWVASDTTAKFLFEQEWVEDDEIRLEPPSVLLPEGKLMRYEEIIRYGRETDPEYFDSYIIRKRIVRFGDFDFYYRRSHPESDALPIGIEVDRRDERFMSAGSALN